MITKMHHYFLLVPNPWAFMISLSLFNLMFSLLMFFKYFEFNMFLVNLLMVSFVSFYWWMNYKKEFSFEGMGSLNLSEGIKMAMILFISSEIFFFFSFFWSYFHFFLSPGMENGFMWPSVGVSMFEAELVPFLNTLILLSSGVTVTISHYYLNMGEKKIFNFFLKFTIILGATFSYFQFLEYQESFFSLSDGNYGTVFFMLTGFHGIHVLIGSFFLLMTLSMSFSLTPSKSEYVSFEMACWYWHFVDVVWIFLFFFLYFLNN